MTSMRLMVLEILFVATLSVLLCGCVYSDVPYVKDNSAQLMQLSKNEDRSRYIESLRKIAVVPKPKGSSDGWYNAVPDRDLYPFDDEATRQVYKRDYRIVYAERQYLSYYCEDFFWDGNIYIPHPTYVVGTIDRRTGKILTLDDVDEFSDRDALKRRLKDAVMSKMKDEIVASRAFLHNNFYLDSDGWHFVYNAGEIDSLSTGVIDVVIARMFLKEKINGE